MLGLIVVASESGPGLSPEGLFEPLLGAPLLARAIAGALPSSEAVTGVLVVPEGCVERARAEVIERFGLDEIDRVVAGGPDRLSAVRAALDALPADVERVIVQDAARALVPSGLVDRVVAACHDADAAVPAVQVRGYVVADEDGTLTPVQARPRLRELQGPQVFPVARLRAVIEEGADVELAEGVALAGGTVALVEGDVDNLLLCSAADTSRALEVFSRRAVEYAFVYPKDLLPTDPLAAALDPGEVPGDEDPDARVEAADDGDEGSGEATDGGDEIGGGDGMSEVEAAGVEEAEAQTDWAEAADIEARVPETDETTRMPAAPGPDGEEVPN